MAFTSSQSRAHDQLLQEQNNSAEDYVGDNAASGWDAIGRVKYNSNPTLTRGVGGIHGGSAGLLHENLYSDYIKNGPAGLKIGDFLQIQNNGLDPNSLAYGQAIKDQRVGDLQKAADWWDANPNGEKPSWMDKHGFALTAVVMSLGVGAALYGAGAVAAGAAEGGAGGVGAAGAAGGLGEAGVGAAGVGASGVGGAGAAGAGLGELGAAGAAGSAAIPTVTITGAAGGAGAGGLGALGTAGVAGAGAAGLGALANAGGSQAGLPSQASLEGNPNNGQYPDSLSQIPGNPPASAGDAGSAMNAGSSARSGLASALGGGNGGSGGTNWGSLINSGLGLIGGNVDRIKANQDAEWWKGQLDTLGGMYKPGTPEATLMQKEMEAKDAAAGRRSQYGIRATDLAAKLAQQRAQIMTSAGYQNMANAYRNRSSQDLNGLFAAAGNMGGSNGSGWNTLINGLGSYFGGSSATTVSPPPR